MWLPSWICPDSTSGRSRSTVLRPRGISAVDEIRQPDSGVLGELRIEPHHVGVDAVVQGQRQQVAVTGDAAERAAAGKRHPRREHRRRSDGFRCGLRDPRLPADGCPGEADPGKGLNCWRDTE